MNKFHGEVIKAISDEKDMNEIRELSVDVVLKKLDSLDKQLVEMNLQLDELYEKLNVAKEKNNLVEQRAIGLDIKIKEGISEMVGHRIEELYRKLPSDTEDLNKIATEIAEKHHIQN